MHDPKLDPGYGLTYKLEATPARHTQWEGGHAAGYRGLLPEAPKDRAVASGRARTHKFGLEWNHVINSAGMCVFVMMAGPNNRIPEWINLATGWDMTSEEALKVGERIANLRMAFNIREGDIVTRRRVPGRLIGSPPLAAGPHQGFTLDLATMEKEYLEACDWDLETARPSRAKLEELGLRDVAEAIGAK